MTSISAEELNQLATKIAEVDKYNPPVSHGMPEDPGALEEAFYKLYQPLAQKYGLDIDTVLMFRDLATDWVNTVVDGDHDPGAFYDRMLETAQFTDDEDEEAEVHAAAIAKADLNGLFYDILIMMVEDRDWPTDTKKSPVVN